MSETRGMPIRTLRVELTGIYEGFWADLRCNQSYAAKLELRSGDAERAFAAFAELIRAWNIPDADGNVLPLPTTAEALRRDIPDEVLDQLITLYGEKQAAAAQLPLAPATPSGPV